MVGLQQIFDELETRDHKMKFFNGIIGSPTFEDESIKRALPQVLEFLLKNNISSATNGWVSDENSDNEYKPLEYATKKLNEAKAKNDKEAIANYEKIIEILREYEAK
ncbi:hypothetical protein [Helicobacter monodelphidis]|uniref:hypothetical protein n=1 Tax=Helicobacter sp. 15-1451 TaxID=2004995 RepID=UPI0015EC5476|nr:hypothetical protein [Helicobacter sp. 15-1451]